MTRQLTSLFLNSCVLFCFSLLIFAARYFTKHVKCLLFIIIESAKYYLRRFPHTLGLVCSSLFSTFNFIVFLVAFFCQWYKTILLGGALLSLRFTLHLWHKRVKVDCLRNCEIGRRPEFGNSIRRRCPCCCLSSRCSRSFALKPPSPASLRHLATGPVLVSWRARNTFYKTSFFEKPTI